MIRDLSLTLQAMLKQSGLPNELAAAEIEFDRPGENFTPKPPATIDLFLYDIRENLELRNAEPLLERVNGHAARRPPPLRVACTYLVTAWPVGESGLALQEHRLLGQTLQVLARYPTIPVAFLQDSLRGQQPPLPLVTAQPDGLKEPAEFWSAIGGRLRPSLSVTVTIGLEVFAADKPVALVTAEEIRIGHSAGGAPRLRIGGRVLAVDGAPRLRIGGRVLAVDGAAVAGAAVALVEADLSATTGADGRYVIGPVAPGRYTLRAQSGALTGTVTVTIPRTTPPGNYDVQLTSS